jgi:serine protease Do
MVKSRPSRFKAKVLGSDPKTDVAVLKINADKPAGGQLGTSESLRVGRMGAGHRRAFGFENPVTAGVVSAKGRSAAG